VDKDNNRSQGVSRQLTTLAAATATFPDPTSTRFYNSPRGQRAGAVGAVLDGVGATVVIKARGTAGHPNVVLDGFGVRH
jgi:hypothetical protein